MKVIKKIFLTVFVIMVGLFVTTGCVKEKKEKEINLEEAVAKLYENVPKEERAMVYKIDDNNYNDFLKTSKVYYEEAYGTSPINSNSAHEVVLIKLKYGVNVGKTIESIKRNINLNKWDKPFPEEDVVIKSKDDLVILIIVENEEVRATIVESFNNL